jgi:hypothetical protein
MRFYHKEGRKKMACKLQFKPMKNNPLSAKIKEKTKRLAAKTNYQVNLTKKQP